MSFCQVGLLFQQHYVWVSESNKLPCSFQAVSPLDEEQVIRTQSCQISSVTKYFWAGGCRVNLYCSSKDLCSWRSHTAIPGTVFRGNRWEPALLKGPVGALDSSVLSSPLENASLAESLCCQPAWLGSTPLHWFLVAVFHGIGCACRKLLSMQRNGRVQLHIRKVLLCCRKEK